jgi:hypothetical protein
MEDRAVPSAERVEERGRARVSAPVDPLTTPGSVVHALSVVAAQHSTAVVDTDFESEGEYRRAVEAVTAATGPSHDEECPIEATTSPTRGGRRRIAAPDLAPDSPPTKVIELLGEWMREIVREQLGQPDPNEWVDQTRSPFGSRKHRRLVNTGVLPGRKAGKQVFVRRRDIDAYLANHSTVVPQNEPEERDEVDAELQRLGLQGGG